MEKNIYCVDADTIHTIYTAGFTHGANEGNAPYNGTFDACDRLMNDESPRLNGVTYGIKKRLTPVNNYTLLQEENKRLKEALAECVNCLNTARICFISDTVKSDIQNVIDRVNKLI